MTAALQDFPIERSYNKSCHFPNPRLSFAAAPLYPLDIEGAHMSIFRKMMQGLEHRLLNGTFEMEGEEIVAGGDTAQRIRLQEIRSWKQIFHCIGVWNIQIQTSDGRTFELSDPAVISLPLCRAKQPIKKIHLYASLSRPWMPKDAQQQRPRDAVSVIQVSRQALLRFNHSV